MKTVLLSVFKNIALLALLAVVSVFVFTVYIRRSEFMLLFYSLGGMYLVLSLGEIISQRNVARKNADVYGYITDSVIARSFIIIALFVVMGVVLYISGSIIKYMALLCFLRAAQELAIVVYKWVSGSMCICISAEVIYLMTRRMESVSAGQLNEIHHRHGLVYLLKKDGKTLTIRMDIMKSSEAFRERLHAWAASHGIPEVVEP